MKGRAVKQLGGKCAICGYDKCNQALDFHHIGEKDFDISSKWVNYSWKKVSEEIKQCILLCANCHREVHAGVTAI